MSLRSRPWLPRLKRAVLGVAMVAALTACGGDVHDRFRPSRILSVGDEYSYIDPATGAKYSVNRARSDGSYNCDEYLLWNQIVAADYGIRFEQCTPPDRNPDTRGQVLAQPGTLAADIQAQVDNFGGFRDGDLILVQVGANDVWELFQRGVNGESWTALAEEARTRGRDLGTRIDEWTRRGARILVLDVINQGSTPEAGAVAQTVSNARTRLRELTSEFNKGLRQRVADVANRRIAFLRANDRVQVAVDDDQYNFDNRSAAGCTVSPATDCTQHTLRPDFDPNPNRREYIFSADRYLTPAMNHILGDVAVGLIDDFPF